MNEEILIEELFKRVHSSMSVIGEDYEVILVDDGSHDNTLVALKRCNEKD
jgi:glycosyltransferase involved in cell wall biosynthesis